MAKRVLLGVLTLVMLFAFAGAIASGIWSFRTDTLTQAYSGTTGVAETSVTLTLTRDLYENEVSNVISVTSNETGETPVATSYTGATNALVVASLPADTARMLTVNYYADKQDDILNAFGGYMTFLVFGGIIGAIIWSIYKKR
jgi:hypothetical protein